MARIVVSPAMMISEIMTPPQPEIIETSISVPDHSFQDQEAFYNGLQTGGNKFLNIDAGTVWFQVERSPNGGAAKVEKTDASLPAPPAGTMVLEITNLYEGSTAEGAAQILDGVYSHTAGYRFEVWVMSPTLENYRIEFRVGGQVNSASRRFEWNITGGTVLASVSGTSTAAYEKVTLTLDPDSANSIYSGQPIQLRLLNTSTGNAVTPPIVYFDLVTLVKLT